MTLSTCGWGSLCFTRTFRIATDDLNAVGVDLVGIIELEVNILDNEGPDVIAEAVCVKMSLECQPCLDLLGKHIGHGPVKVGENLHGELGLYSALGNEVVQRVCKRAAQAASAVELIVFCVVGGHGAGVCDGLVCSRDGDV